MNVSTCVAAARIPGWSLSRFLASTPSSSLHRIIFPTGSIPPCVYKRGISAPSRRSDRRCIFLPCTLFTRNDPIMASYQPHHPQVHPQSGRRGGVRNSINSLHSSWIIAELARATHENVFSDTLSSPLTDAQYTVPPESEVSAEHVFIVPSPGLTG